MFKTMIRELTVTNKKKSSFPLLRRIISNIKQFLIRYALSDKNLRILNYFEVKQYSNTTLDHIWCSMHTVYHIFIHSNTPQSEFTCSKLTIETLQQGVKYVES